VTEERPVAFFCAEYGIHASLPIYSGGLGALAGDILKEASDRALPLVAVGLLYHQGYFRQHIDAAGWQHESWVPTDPERQPAALVSGDDDRPLEITVPVGDEDIVAQVWRVDVGRVPLFLLDTDRPENSLVARWISSRLYTGTRDLRLAQYALLGVGGNARAARDGDRPVGRAPQRGPRRLRLARARPRRGRDRDGARRSARLGPRAHGLHHPHAGTGGQRHLRARPGGRDVWSAGRRGRPRPRPRHPPRALASRRRRRALRRHPVRAAHQPRRQRRQPPSRRGRARHVGALWPERPVEEVPIGHVTNGVHLPTWLGEPMRALLDRHLGEGWMARAADPATWAPIDAIDGAELWAARSEQRAELAQWARERSVLDRLGRDEPRDYVEAPAFDPDVLTLGFARRLATYKRLHLLLRSAPRIVELLSGERSVQILLAGKAHPRDEDGKRSLQRSSRPRRSPRSAAASPTSTTMTSASAPGWCAAATCGSTCRARRWRRAAPAG